VDAHVRGLDGILAALGMAGAPVTGAPDRPAHLRRFLWLRCADEGWWEPAVEPGQAVAEGQLLGTVSSLDGARLLQEITAPAAGVPLFVTSSPAVAADGLLLGLGAT
jgi:predicted deacylase